MHGAGKYDPLLTQARKAAGATSAALIVIDGNLGPGFSVQCVPENLLKLPAMLRLMATQIEADLIRYKA